MSWSRVTISMQTRQRASISADHVHACTCIMQVPFSGSFANHVQWVAVGDGHGGTRLEITGERNWGIGAACYQPDFWH